MRIKLNNACEIQQILVAVILFPFVPQYLYLLVLRCFLQFLNLELSFPSIPAPRLLNTAGKFDKIFLVDSVASE